MAHFRRRSYASARRACAVVASALGGYALFLCLGLPVVAQPAQKVPRIGYLSGGALASLDDFKKNLRELGYIDARSVTIDQRVAEGKSDRLPALAAELVRSKPDVIVASGMPSARAAKDATTTIPIVVMGAGDLVGRGIVSSLARPGGNITGATNISPDLSGKRLELLKEIIPRTMRVAVLHQPHEEDELRGTEAAARSLAVQIQRKPTQGQGQLASTYAAIAKDGDALLIFQNEFTSFHRKELLELALQNRLPTMCEGRVWVDQGCLVSYAANRAEMVRRAAMLVDKILKGRKPADLPVEQPTTFELSINLKTAKQLGLTIPPSILVRADHVVR